MWWRERERSDLIHHFSCCYQCDNGSETKGNTKTLRDGETEKQIEQTQKHRLTEKQKNRETDK